MNYRLLAPNCSGLKGIKIYIYIYIQITYFKVALQSVIINNAISYRNSFYGYNVTPFTTKFRKNISWNEKFICTTFVLASSNHWVVTNLCNIYMPRTSKSLTFFLSSVLPLHIPDPIYPELLREFNLIVIQLFHLLKLYLGNRLL